MVGLSIFDSLGESPLLLWTKRMSEAQECHRDGACRRGANTRANRLDLRPCDAGRVALTAKFADAKAGGPTSESAAQ